VRGFALVSEKYRTILETVVGHLTATLRCLVPWRISTAKSGIQGGDNSKNAAGLDT
jgi:hypothetical protein